MRRLLVNKDSALLINNYNLLTKVTYCSINSKVKLFEGRSESEKNTQNLQERLYLSINKTEYLEYPSNKHNIRNPVVNKITNIWTRCMGHNSLNKKPNLIFYLNKRNNVDTDNNKGNNTQFNDFKQQQSGSSACRVFSLKRFFVLLFLIKIYYQNCRVKCDYDMNDMMLTMELQDLALQQQNQKQLQRDENRKNQIQIQIQKKRKQIQQEKEAQSQKQKIQGQKIAQGQNKKVSSQKKHQNQSPSQPIKNNTNKDQRYGTVQQMIKNQFQSSQDFQSVQERIIFREIQQKRHNKSKYQNKNADHGKMTHKQEQQEKIANVVFRSQTQNKVKQSQPQIQGAHQFDFSERPQELVVGQKYEDIDPRLNKIQILQISSDRNSIKAQHKEQQDKQYVNKITSQLDVDQLKNNILNANNEVQLQKQGDSQVTQMKQQSQSSLEMTNNRVQNDFAQIKQIQKKNSLNCAQIYVPSSQFLPLSKRIQNFLRLRGIEVNVNQKVDRSSQVPVAQFKNLSLHLCNKLAQCKEISFYPQNTEKRDVFHHINNFLNPPHIIESIQQAKNILKLIQIDECIVGSYIPQTSQDKNYQQSHRNSQFNTFSLRYAQTDNKKAQKQFNQYKYLSSTKKNCFIIVRNPQVSSYLKISQKKIGVPHILYKYDKQLNGMQSEPNCKIGGDLYYAVGNLDKIILKQNLNTTQKIAHKINELTEKGFTNINIAEDLNDKVRHLKQLSQQFYFKQKNSQQQANPLNKKLLITKINQQKPEVQQQINKILQKVSKLNRKQVSIVKTQSELLLKSSILRILPSDQYGTVRLFDLGKLQQPFMKLQQKQLQNTYFQRYYPNGPFQIQFLSRFISNLSQFDKNHVQADKSVNKLSFSYPGDFSLSQQNQGKYKLVLFYKDGCQGCKILQGIVNKILQLNKALKVDCQKQITKRIRKQICLKYLIQDPKKLASIQISKFNILNEDNTIQVPQTTPTLCFFNGTNSYRTVLKTDQLFGHLSKVNANNGQMIQDHMVKGLIEEIEKNIRRFESMI